MTGVGRLPRGPWRGGGRTVALMCVAFLVVALTYMWHNAHMRVTELREAATKCMQHQEVLAAQMEVVVEYKLRLEKSLQQEKNDHRHTRESLQARAEEERSLRERQVVEASNRYSSLQQQYKILQGQHGDLEEETQKLRSEKLEWLERKSSLENSVKALQQQLTQLRASKAAELDDLKTQFIRLEDENKGYDRRLTDALVDLQKSKARQRDYQREVDTLYEEKQRLKERLTQCKGQLQEAGQRVGPAPPAAPLNPDAPSRRSSTVSARIARDKQGPGGGAAVGARPPPAPSPSSAGPVFHGVGAADKQSKPSTPQINPMAVLSREKVAQPAAAAPPPLQQEGEGEADNEENAQGAAGGDSPVGARPHHEEPALPVAPDDGTNVGVAPPLGAADSAVAPPPPPQRKLPAAHEDVGERHYDVPQGVVPAPHGYILQKEEPAAGEDENDEGGGAGVRPLAAAGYPPWPHFQLGAQPRRQVPQHGLRLRNARHNELEPANPAPPQEEEEDEDAGEQVAPHYDGGDYLQEPVGAGGAQPAPERHAGPHGPPPGGNVDAAVDRPRDDPAAPEEGEEEEDDDMDHIDYNDGAQQRQPGRQQAKEAAVREREAVQSAGVHEPPLPVQPRESVMVNPKK